MHRVREGGTPVRVLVTGSRDWPCPETVVKALIEAWMVKEPGDDFIIVHGHCPKGADAAADRFARHMEWPVERHPADWDRYGKIAGFRRNREMVQAGADMCLAFIAHGSRGASHCASAADKAGIPVRRYLA
jgi:hypothetical protein